MSKYKQAFGVLGSLMILVGLFLPAYVIPIWSTLKGIKIAFLPSVYLSISNLSTPDSANILLLLAILSFFLSIFEKYKWLWLTGCCSLVAFSLKLVSIYKFEVKRLKSGGFAQPANLHWGLAVVLIGILFVIAAAAIQKEE